MRVLHLLVGIVLATCLTASGARAGSRWSATLYAGVGTDRNITDILDSGFSVQNTMVGFSLDRRLFNLGGGVAVGAEGQLTQYTLGHNYETASLGIGLEFSRFPWRRRTTLSIYSGPSYAINPVTRAKHFKGKALLNYLGMELAVGLSRNSKWDGVVRVYHRSGMWGIYSLDYDESTVLGIGIRRRF